MNPTDLTDAALAVGDYWKIGDDYYDGAELEMADRWTHLIAPFLSGSAVDFSHCADLAAGHGRNTAHLLAHFPVETVACIDINQENIDFCARRFAAQSRVRCIRNDGFTITGVQDRSITYFHCFDAMVHFDSDVLRAYLGEIRRVLCPRKGLAFLHHSNLTKFPGRDVYGHSDNTGSRNFMSGPLLAHYAAKTGLEVVRQEVVDWLLNGEDIDCFSLLRHPAF